MRKIIYSICAFFSFALHAQEVEILSDFNISDLPTQLEPVKKVYKINVLQNFNHYLTHNPHRKELRRILIFNPFFKKNQREVINKLPKEKLVLFVFEPYLLSAEFYQNYSRVYTWDDHLVDNVKFFRFSYPNLMPFSKNSIPYENRKLCAIVTGNWNEYRLNTFHFFEKHHPNQLDCYGRCPPPNIKNVTMYKGTIPGSIVAGQKVTTLKNYRFSICFEHEVGLDGYITEKIFSCFTAGSVPIYWGAKNIEKYIPKTCFIDYRDFSTDQDLYDYLTSMTKERHQEYVEAIKTYLQSEKAQIFSPESFEKILLEAITQ